MYCSSGLTLIFWQAAGRRKSWISSNRRRYSSFFLRDFFLLSDSHWGKVLLLEML